MALLKENINNLIVDDLDKRNQNWTTIDDSLELKADKTYVDNKVKTDVPVGAKFTDTVYSHPTTAGNKHIPTGGASGQILRYSASGTAIWGEENDTITTINGKTGAIAKADIVALGIPAQDTVVDISGKADKTYVDSQVALKADIAYVNDLAFGGEGEIDVSYKADITYVDSQDALKADKTYVDSKVQTDVPSGAKFTDTITTINGKTGAISKADIVALGIPSQDTIYNHPSTHPASMITESSTKRFVSDTEKATWNSKSDTDTVTTINGKTGAISKADIVALGIPAQDTVYTHPAGTNPHGTTKSDVGLSNVDNVKQMPISGGILENYTEKIVEVSYMGNIDLSQGNVFTWVLPDEPSPSLSCSITNAINGVAHSFTLIVKQTFASTPIIFPASVKWQGGEIPDLSTASKTYVLTFMTVDGGTTWLGMFGGEF